MNTSKNVKRDILSHWGWAVPILLIVAALAIRQIDLYPPSPDEFFTMHDAGWLDNRFRAPVDIVAALIQNNPNQSPGYFIFLSLWGSLTAYKISLGRVLMIFAGLLSLTMAYRLARDFAAPVAGLFALIIVASNAFYNFYVPYLRPYSLLVFIAGGVLWIYLRILYQQKKAKLVDCLALAVAVFSLVYTHGFSLAFLAALGIYHLFFVPKNQHWRRVSLAAALAVLLFLPWIGVLISAMSPVDGSLNIVDRLSSPVVDSSTAVNAWLTVILNNQPPLLLLSLIGLVFGIWKKKISPQPYLILFLLFLLTMTLLAQFTTWVRVGTIRHHLAGWLPFALFFAAGLYSLYCFRKWLGMLVLLWVIAGAVFQQTANWNQYVRDRRFALIREPTHIISRLALQAEQKPLIIGYRYNSFLLNWSNYVNYNQRDYYFRQHDLTLEPANDLKNFEDDIRQRAIAEPSIWVFYQTSKVAAEAAEIESIMDNLNHQLCDTVEVGIDTVIRQYAWETLNCQPRRLLVSHQTDIINYQFYGAALHAAESKLYFSDQWAARIDNDLSGFQMSYQLISADWNNVAQLDLPLVHEGQPRLFSIDIANVPAGTYRLMAILYDKHSGQRQNWLNSEDDPPDMLTLTEMIIP